MNLAFSTLAPQHRFVDLCSAVQSCDLCERMSERKKVLSNANGCITSKVLFIAEAPGRLGADRTGIPLFGDATGNNFETLLKTVGWNRSAVFITNAILCNPRCQEGNNGTPTKDEVMNCSAYLKMVINLIEPDVIVTLGRVALEALNSIHPHTYSLSKDIAMSRAWAGKTLFPLYHPGPRARVHRSFASQTADFFRLAGIVDPIIGLKKKPSTRVQKRTMPEPALLAAQPAIAAILLTLSELKRLSLFKLTKLLFLIDVESIERFHKSLTGQTYLRQANGPWQPQLTKILSGLDMHGVRFLPKGKNSYVLLEKTPPSLPPLSNQEREIIERTLKRHGRKSDSEIKTAAYLTRPMKYLLRQEKLGRNLRNKPVIHKDQTIIEMDADGLFGS